MQVNIKDGSWQSGTGQNESDLIRGQPQMVVWYGNPTKWSWVQVWKIIGYSNLPKFCPDFSMYETNDPSTVDGLWVLRRSFEFRMTRWLSVTFILHSFLFEFEVRVFHPNAGEVNGWMFDVIGCSQQTWASMMPGWCVQTTKMTSKWGIQRCHPNSAWIFRLELTFGL